MTTRFLVLPIRGIFLGSARALANIPAGGPALRVWIVFFVFGLGAFGCLGCVSPSDGLPEPAPPSVENVAVLSLDQREALIATVRELPTLSDASTLVRLACGSPEV